MSSTLKNSTHLTFLSKPPPPKRALPPPPPPSSSPAAGDRNKSIIAWASLVQPGSPPPRSPQRRPSVSSSRRSSFSRLNRRPSISHGRAPSGSLSHIVDSQQKTPSVGDFDLTALGYTSVFVHLPKTPTTPSPYLRQRSRPALQIPPVSKPLPPPSPSAYAHIPIPPMPSEEPTVKRTGLSRFPFLRSRSSKSEQQQQQPSPAKSKSTKSKKHSAPTETSSSDIIAKRKRAKYTVPPPPPLANELALMQFLEGGNIESHAKRLMESQAKAAAGSRADLAVADVYRDANGGIWWDADEELEYTHLLADTSLPATPPIPFPGNKPVTVDWEDFGAAEPCYDSFFTNLQLNKENNDPLNLDRRDSVSSLDSDLDPKYLVTVPEHALGGFNAPVEDRVLASHKIGGPGMSILSLPSRSTRKALHLNKTEFLVDVAAFGPRSPKSNIATSTQPKPKGQARRRPAPLKLTHQTQRPPAVTKTPAVQSSMEKVREEFIADSFAPVPTTKTINAPLRPIPAQPHQIMNKKPSRANMRGLFGRRVD